MAGSNRIAPHRGNIRANGRRRKARRGDRQTRLSVERLEQRTLLTVGFLPGVPVWQAQGPAGIGTDPNSNVGAIASVVDVRTGTVTYTVLGFSYTVNAYTVYADTTNGGVWRADGVTSVNLAQTIWRPLTDHEPSLAVGPMALDPNDPTGNTLWVGTGTQSSAYGTGGPAVGLLKTSDGLKTTDGGPTWINLRGTAATSITGASNASPIVITTSNTSNLSNGSQVTISGATGNTNANGTWTISHVTPTGFTLASNDDGTVSSGTGNYAGGGTWATSIDGYTINSVLPTKITDPTTGKQVILVATNGQGLWRSNDGGANFAPVGYGFLSLQSLYTNAYVTSLVADPLNHDRFYAALAGVGVFESVDGGLGWIEIDNSISQITQSANGLSLAAKASGGNTYLYAVTSQPTPPGVPPYGGVLSGAWRAVLTSDPLAVSWQAIAPANVPSGAFVGPAGHFGVLTDPTNPNVIYVSGWVQTLYRVNITGEAPGGQTLNGSWTPLSGTVGTLSLGAPHDDQRTLAFLDNTTLLDTNDGGIFGLTNPQNPGQFDQWVSANGNIQDTEFWSVAYDTINGLIFGGSQDNGTPAQQAPPSTTWYSTRGGDGWRVAADNSGSEAVYYNVSNSSIGRYQTSGVPAGSASTGLWLADTNADLARAQAGGTQWTGLNTADQKTYQANLGGDGSYPYAVDTFYGGTPEPLLLGLTGVYESTVQGTGANPYGVGDIISNVSPSGMTGNVNAITYASSLGAAYFGTNTSELWQRPFASSPFSKMTPPLGWSGANAVEIVADPANYLIAYVLDSYGRIWRTTDAGYSATNWKQLNGNLTLSQADTIDLYDPTPSTPGDGVLLVGGLGGVYRMNLQPGALFSPQWSLYGQALPDVVVKDLHYVPTNTNTGYGDLLLAGTFGYGAWTIPNASASLNVPAQAVGIAATNATIVLRTDPFNTANAQLLVNNQLEMEQPWSDLPVITIDTLDGSASNNNNSVDIQDVAANTGVIVFLGAGTNTVNVNTTSYDFSTIKGKVAVYTGSGGSDNLYLNDQGDKSGRTITIKNAASPAGFGFIGGLDPAGIFYQYSPTTTLTLETDAVAGNQINVLETAVTTTLVVDAPTSVSIGDSTVGAQSILGDLYLQSFESYVLLHGGTPDAGNLSVTINDTANKNARTPTASTFAPKVINLFGKLVDDTDWGSISGLAPATINYEYLDTKSVTIDPGPADKPVVDNQDQGDHPPPIYYGQPPSVSGVYATSGKQGDIITVFGYNLGGATAVTFDNTLANTQTPATILSIIPPVVAGPVILRGIWDVQVRVPTGTGTVDVTVTTPGGTSVTSSTDQFIYVPDPAVSGVSPGAGPLTGGTSVTISGSNLSGATAVDFGSAPAIHLTNNANGTITATSPAGTAGPVNVTVVTAAGTSATSSADTFTYTAAPVVYGISPSSGPVAGGTRVVLVGANLNGVSEVDFGLGHPGMIVSKSATQVVVSSPSEFAGTVDVTVVTPGGPSATSAKDKFTYIAAPVLIPFNAFPFTAVFPNFGPYEGGTTVTINGANLAGATAVNFGTIAGTIVSDTATQIVALSPAQPLGSIVDVTVTTAGGTSALLFGDLFQYTHEPPYVYNVSPPSGPLAGGTTVTITGMNLLGATEVDFGSVLGGPKATSFTVNSPTQITATSPAETAGTVDVTVVTPGERSAISGNDKYTYSASIVPIVSSLSPSSGLVAGGTTVTITGTNLSGATAVDFGPTAGTITFVSATEIDATSPARAAGTVDVTVVTPIGTTATSPADQFTYQVPSPVVSTVSPSSGPTTGGTSVTISGSNLSGATAVEFGQTAGTIVSDTATQITVTSPAGTTGAVDVTVVTSGGTSAISPYDQFHYGAAPTISALIDGGNLIHNLGPSNTRGFGLYIFGGNLNGVTEVDFGAVTAPFIDTRDGPDGYIFATTPSEGPGTVDVRVVTPSGTSAITPADQFTFTAAPFVTNVANTGSFFGAGGPVAGGTSVTIQGYHLSDVTAVNFGNTPAASFTFDSYSATIIAVSPTATAGTVNVTVTSPEGTSTVAPAQDQFTYYPAPTVSGISPASGPLAGGNSVLITGTNLLGAVVYFGGVPTFGSGSDTSILVDAPAGASPGTVDVTLVTAGGTTATSAADQYTYLIPPVVSGLSTSAGAIAGGTTVTISGTGLAGATAVDFGPNNAAMILSDTDGQIVVTSPATNVAGMVDVTVTTLNGPSINSPADQFTYEGPPSIYTQDKYSGPVGGGTLVTLTGISLANASAVDFGSNPGTIISNTDSQIVVRIPEATGDAVGTVAVTVVTQYGTSPSNQFGFTYVLPPVVTGISQSEGPETGGTYVTISGSNLFGATAVDFGSTPATNFAVNFDGSVTAIIPAGAASTVDVTVVAPGGTSAASSADQFTYVVPPTVSAIGPVAGPISGGTPVTITGTGLAGATRVDFNDGQGDDSVGTIVSDTNGQLVVTSPSFGFGGTFDVTVTTIGGTSATSPADQFTFAAAPTVSDIGPTFGFAGGGDLVTINGTNLDNVTAVDFGPNAATIFSETATQIEAISPPGAVGPVDVRVVTPVGTSATSQVDGFLYIGAPLTTADNYTTVENSPLTVGAPGVLANDSDPQGLSLTATLATEPAHGMLSFGSDGSFTYTPDSGYLGADSFIYQASNACFSSGPTTVSITIGTLTVTTTADSGPGSLRQAILDANGTPGTPDTIQFELPAGPQTINLLTPLPAATDPLTVSLDNTQNVTVVLSSATAWNNDNSLTLSGAGNVTFIGGIEGPGNLTVDAGSNLTANHITLGALVIGGTADAPAMVTIAASDASGNPLGAQEGSGNSALDSALGVAWSGDQATTQTGGSSSGAEAVPAIGQDANQLAVPSQSLAVVASSSAVSAPLTSVTTLATGGGQQRFASALGAYFGPDARLSALPLSQGASWQPSMGGLGRLLAAGAVVRSGFATAEEGSNSGRFAGAAAVDVALEQADFATAIDDSLFDLLAGAVHWRQ